MKLSDDFDGALFGYARVSTEDQSLDLQIDALVAAGVPREYIFTEKQSGRTMERRALMNMIDLMNPGDCLVVWKLDRLGRSALGVAQVVAALNEQNKHFRTLDWDIDTTHPFGKMIFQIMAAMAELESNLISERTKAGIAAAKARGKEYGRKGYIVGYPKRLRAFTDLWTSGDLDGMSAQDVVAAMHKADPKAPRFRSPQSYLNWKSRGYPGFDVEAANALRGQEY